MSEIQNLYLVCGALGIVCFSLFSQVIRLGRSVDQLRDRVIADESHLGLKVTESKTKNGWYRIEVESEKGVSVTQMIGVGHLEKLN